MSRCTVFAALMLASGGAAAYGFEPVQTLLPDVSAQALAVGDVSGDGLDDLVMLPRPNSGEDHSEVLIAVQQANGVLATPVAVEFGSQGLMFGSVGLADMDDDGALDIVVGETFALTILRNEGALQFSAHAIVEEHGPPVFDFEDIDGDGHLDIVATTGTEVLGTFSVYNGDGNGGIREKTTLSLAGANGLYLFDINSDGRRDLAYSRAGDIAISWRNDDGFSPDLTVVPLGSQALGYFAFSDFNADGRVDFVAARSVNAFDNPLIALYEQRADGRFRASGSLKSYDLPSVPRFHDMDGDGREDLVVPHRGWGAIGLYTAHSKGLEIESLFAGYAGRSAELMGIGDLNGDGRQDIATASHVGGISFLAGRDLAIEPDLAVYPGLTPNAAAVRLQNHSAYTDTGPNYLSVDLDVRTGPFDVGTLPAGCERQPWGVHGVRLTCNIDALAPGAHTTITFPLTVGPQSSPNLLTLVASGSQSLNDLRPANNIATKRITIWPGPVRRASSRERSPSRVAPTFGGRR